MSNLNEIILERSHIVKKLDRLNASLKGAAEFNILCVITDDDNSMNICMDKINALKNYYMTRLINVNDVLMNATDWSEVTTASYKLIDAYNNGAV